MSGGKLNQCPLLISSNWVHMSLHVGLARIPSGTDWQANTRCLYASFNTTAVLGGCAEDVLISSSRSCCLVVLVVHVWEAKKNQTRTTERLKPRNRLTIRLKRRRGCYIHCSQLLQGNLMQECREEGSADIQEERRTALLRWVSHGSVSFDKLQCAVIFCSPMQGKRCTCLVETLTVIFKKMRINKTQSLKTEDCLLSIPKVLLDKSVKDN